MLTNEEISFLRELNRKYNYKYKYIVKPFWIYGDEFIVFTDRPILNDDLFWENQCGCRKGLVIDDRPELFQELDTETVYSIKELLKNK